MLRTNFKKLKATGVSCIIATLAAVFAANASAITPTPAMLEQFKKMPKSEQQRLMKQYGISPAVLSQPQQPIINPAVVIERSEKKQQQIAKQVKEAIAPVVKKVEVADAPAKALPLKRFGYDMFAGEPTTFAPVSDVPVPSDYLMGPGDVIKVQIYGKDNRQYSLAVARSGNIQMPELGPISVMGLTFQELKNALTKKIQEQYIGVESSISLGELRSIRIVIAGESYKPGTYSVSALSTMTQALFISGGINGIGSLRNITLNRGGKPVGSFDLYELLTKGFAANDFRLQSGDIIFIPPVGTTVAIKGEVRRPAIYEMKAGENVSDLIRLAAGLKANSYPQASLLQTFDNNHLPQLISVDLTNTQQLDLKLKDGDVLTVKSTTNRVQQQVTLVGAINRPGVYQWRQDMKIGDVIQSLWTDLKASADLDYALLTRKINLQGDIEVLQFSLKKIFDNPDSAANYGLKPEDQLVILSKNDEASRRALLDPIIGQLKQQRKLNSAAAIVSVSGAVRFSGHYPIVKNNRISDLLLWTDLKDSADLNYALLTRKINLQGDIEVMHFSLDQLLQNPDSPHNLLLQPQDKLVLFGKNDGAARRELLDPIIEQLKRQVTHQGTTSVASITGEVYFPGEYPIAENDRLNDLITAAGGLKESAHLKRAELTSLIVDPAQGASVIHHSVDLQAVISGAEPANHYVANKDRLHVLKIPAWQEDLTVTINGEVKFPGSYSVRRGETLNSVIKRAGGYTNIAFLTGAVFTRESIRVQERKQIAKLADQLRLDIAAKGLTGQGMDVSFAESSLMLKELENLNTVGRMVIELTANSLTVEDGDMLYIPAQQRTVTVVGEVQHNSTHIFNYNLDMDQYLQLAGGLKARADDERIYVIRANGSVMIPHWLGQDSGMEPGDTIVVPLNTEHKDNLTLWSQITNILYNTAVAVAAISGL